MIKGLIGYTGFVGSNLVRQGTFQKTYNSKNIADIRGEHFGELFCAGVPAVKWWANRHPEKDWQNIKKLLDNLEHVTVERFVLISTIDVYPNPVDVDEETPIDENELQTYGKNRRKVEEFIEDRYPVHNIIRLPGLFGNGLKKNVIYDLINENEVEKVHSEALFQFYCLDSIFKDIKMATDSDIPLINFATEPVKVKELVSYAFGRKFENKPNYSPASYNMRTKYAHLYNSKAPYIFWKDTILDQIRHFVQIEKGNSSCI